MRPIIQQLNLPKAIYDPSRYPNPSLQWHYQILQALALDEEVPSVVEDKTVPKYRQIDKRVGSETVEWGHELENVYKAYLSENPDAASIGAKRGAAPATNGAASAAKKSKPTTGANADGEAVTEEEVKKLWQEQKLARLTVSQLKEFCTVNGLPLAGRKGDLVERVEAWFERK